MKNLISDSKVSRNYIASSCWDGNYYANNSEWQFHIATLALSNIQIPVDAKILDIGCGDGRFTSYLASLIPKSEILGIDPSPSMLEASQANIRPNLSFVLGDALNIPFMNQFDCVVAFNSLHWVSKINIALEQIHKVLKPGGQVLILVAPIQVRHPLHQIIDKVAKQESWCTYFDNKMSVFSLYTLAEWATLIEESGLISENLLLVDASLDYPDKQAFADFMIGWIPFGTIPENMRKNFVNDIIEAYVAVIPCSPNGMLHFRMDELVIIASKRKTD